MATNIYANNEILAGPTTCTSISDLTDTPSIFTLTSALSLAGVSLIGFVAFYASKVLLPKNVRWQDRYTFIWLVMTPHLSCLPPIELTVTKKKPHVGIRCSCSHYYRGLFLVVVDVRSSSEHFVWTFCRIVCVCFSVIRHWKHYINFFFSTVFREGIC